MKKIIIIFTLLCSQHIVFADVFIGTKMGAVQRDIGGEDRFTKLENTSAAYQTKYGSATLSELYSIISWGVGVWLDYDLTKTITLGIETNLKSQKAGVNTTFSVYSFEVHTIENFLVLDIPLIVKKKFFRKNNYLAAYGGAFYQIPLAAYYRVEESPLNTFSPTDTAYTTQDISSYFYGVIMGLEYRRYLFGKHYLIFDWRYSKHLGSMFTNDIDITLDGNDFLIGYGFKL